MNLIQQLLDSLPNNFSFYHLGDVAVASEDSQSFLSWETEKQHLLSNDRAALSYALSGEVQGCVLILLESGLDTSTYAEMGNIVVSRLVESLETNHFLQVNISAPRTIAGRRLQEHLEKNPPAIRGKVKHSHNGETIHLRVFVTLVSQGAGHA